MRRIVGVFVCKGMMISVFNCWWNVSLKNCQGAWSIDVILTQPGNCLGGGTVASINRRFCGCGGGFLVVNFLLQSSCSLLSFGVCCVKAVLSFLHNSYTKIMMLLVLQIIRPALWNVTFRFSRWIYDHWSCRSKMNDNASTNLKTEPWEAMACSIRKVKLAKVEPDNENQTTDKYLIFKCTHLVLDFDM